MSKPLPYEIVNQGQTCHIKLRGAISWWKNGSEEFERKISEAIDSGCANVHCDLNSPGGIMFEASEFGNLISRFTGTKSITIGALAASSGFNVILYFDQEHTECHSNSMFMYHDPSSYLRIEHEEDFDSNKKLYQDLRQEVVEMIAERTGLSEDVISENMRKTTWLNAKEAKKLGIVSNIKNERSKATKDAKNFFAENHISVPDMVNLVSEVENEPETEPVLNQNSNMNELAKLLGLPENATEDQIKNAITALQAQAKFAVEALKATAKSKGLPEESIENLAKTDWQAVLNLVNGTKTPEAPANNGGDGGDGGKGGEDKAKTDPNNRNLIADTLAALAAQQGGATPRNGEKTWAEMTAQERRELEDKDPEKYEKVFKAAHNHIKNPQD